jgi:predicted ATPase
MLEKIRIDRFKSIHGAELEPGRINLLIGGNGSGKSNVLEAIGVLAAALSRDISDTELARKGVRLSPPALMKSAFKGLDLPKNLCLKADFNHYVSYSLTLTARDTSSHLSFFAENAWKGGQKMFGRGKNGCVVFDQRLKREPDAERGLWDFTRGFFDYDKDVVAQFDGLSRFAIYAPQTEFLREIKTGSAQTPPIGLHGEGLAQAVQGLLSQFVEASRLDLIGSPRSVQFFDAVNLAWLPGWTSGVRVGAVDPILRSREAVSPEGQVVYFIDRFMHERRRTLSAYDSSEGTLFLLFIAVLLGHEQSPKIFALDNVDSALNPKMTRQLIERMVAMIKRKAESNIDVGPDQVFMTSHNPTSLDAFDLTDPDQRVFVVARDGKGRTTIERLQPRADMSREDWLRFTKGRKLSQMWIDGEISGALGVSGDTI